MWTGVTQGHLTYLPRKPTELGFMLKTLVDGDSGILLVAEIAEDKDTMKSKPYTKQLGQTAATTLRLVEPYAGGGYIVIGDSWFGSYKAAYRLREWGLFCIMVVKTNHSRFPLAYLKENMTTRGDVKYCSVEVNNIKVWAGTHMDK